jgi:hypothetical protein
MLAKYQRHFTFYKKAMGDVLGDDALAKMAMERAQNEFALGPQGPPPPPRPDTKRPTFDLAQAHTHVPAAVVKLLRA